MMQRVSIQVGTEAMLSNAPVLNHPPAKKFVYSDNGRAVGGVSPEVAQTLSLRKLSAIVLDNTGIKHIQERHAQGLDALGMTPEQFVAYALENFDAVFLGKLKNSYRLACTVETPKKRAIIKLQFEQEGEH